MENKPYNLRSKSQTNEMSIRIKERAEGTRYAPAVGRFHTEDLAIGEQVLDVLFDKFGDKYDIFVEVKHEDDQRVIPKIEQQKEKEKPCLT